MAKARKGKVDQALDRLTRGGANIRAKELIQILSELGFEVTETENGNHHVYQHDGLDGFYGGGFDAGHGSNAEVLRCYTRDAKKVIREYKADLKILLKESDDE